MIAYRLFLLFDAFVMLLPRRWRKALFIGLALLAHRFAEKRNRIIQKNLDFAFGQKLEASQKNEIEAYCYRNLALNLLQVMENRRNTKKDLEKIITFQNRELIDELIAKGQNMIFVSGHFGNWELGAVAVASLITSITSIYKGFDRQEFNPYLKYSRERHGMHLIEKNGALKHMTRALREKKSISLMIDQASNQKYGILTHFFSQPTYHNTTAAQLAAKFQVPIVSVYIFTHDEHHYTIRFENPIEVPNSDPDSIVEATQMQVNDLEKVISEQPELWFWCHKRWKGENPELYRAG